MARRYVRDKLGRFASHGGGGSFGGGGKMGKSAKNVKARKAYKSASSKVRKADRDFKAADRKSSAARGAFTRSAGKGPAKTQQAAGKWHASMVKREQAARKIGGSKSGLTRVTNRLTGKGAAKAKTSSKKQYASEQSKKYAAARKAPKRSQARREAVASAQIKKGAKARASYKPKQEAKQARERILKKTKAKRMAAGGMKTPKGKMSKAKPSAAKKEYKRASREDRMQGSGATKGRKKVIRKQTGKPAYQQRMGTEAGQTRLGRTKAPRAGSKTKAEKIRGKIESKKAANKALRGDEFKGVKKRTTKAPRKQKGAQAYDGPNKARSEAADRVLAKTKAIRLKRGIKEPTAFSGTAKYSRQGKLSKASKGSGAKQKYKKATSELRKSKRGSSLYQQGQMGHPSKRKQGQVTRLTNKFTNRRAAAAGETNLSRGLKRVDRVKALKTTKNPSVKRYELNYLKQSKALGKKLKNTKIKDPNRYVSPKELKKMKAQQLGTVGNKIVGFKRKKKR